MKVLIAERKDSDSSGGGGGDHSAPSQRPGRTSFLSTLQQSTVIVIAVPRLPSTLDAISTTELQSMQKNAILINVARGGIVSEHALARALREGWIAGAATDVFATEPAGRTTSPLLETDVPNLTVTPHLAWYAQSTQDARAKAVKEIVEGYANGEFRNVVV